MRIVPVLGALLVAVAIATLVPAAAAVPVHDGSGPAPTADALDPTHGIDDATTADVDGGSTPDQRSLRRSQETLPNCAVNPPDNYADPDDDVIGWVDGYWYDEPIDIDQSDGLTEDELNVLIARSSARFEALRCLQANRTPPVELQSREQFVEEQSGLFGNVTESERRFDNEMFETLLMIGTDENSIDVREANRGASVLGYYDPVSERIVVISEGNETLRMDELTLAHELGHAIQDQRFDLAQFNARLRDASNAEDGLVEGDVHYVENLYAQRCESDEWDCETVEQAGDGGGLDLASEGLYLMNFQPYSDGTSFTRTLRDQGGWDAVDEAYESPPTTSKHVIEPETYPEFEPANVSVDAEPNGDWEQVTFETGSDYDRIGQASISAMFMAPTLESGGRSGVIDPNTMYNFGDDGDISSVDPLNYRFEATSGWTGDKFVAYEHPDNETASAWTIEWDSEADAEAFLDLYDELIAYRGATAVDDRKLTYRFGEESNFSGAVAVVHEGSTTTLLNGPSVDALRTLNSDAAPTVETDSDDGTDGSSDDGTDSDDDTDGGTTDEETTENREGSDQTNVSDPNGTTDDDSGTEPAEIPGFGPLAALLGVLLGAAALARRR